MKESYGTPQDILELIQSVGDIDDDKAKINQQPGPYILSWLSSERWQRHTTKGEYSDNIKEPHSRLRRLPQVIVALAAIMVFTLRGGMGPHSQVPTPYVPTKASDYTREFLYSTIVQCSVDSVGMPRPRRLLEISRHMRMEPKCTLHQTQYVLPFLCLVSTQHLKSFLNFVSIIA